MEAGDDLVEAVAEAASVTPTELHHLFRRWAGLSPKAFLQAITLDNAKALLAQSASVLDATYEVGLSGPGRLHVLMVSVVAVTPAVPTVGSIASDHVTVMATDGSIASA